MGIVNNLQIHHRRSIRLSGFDYSQPGAYFITIVAQGRQCLFGEIRDVEMHLNDPGRMVEKWWRELPNKFPSISVDSFVVMPNHLHGIVVIGDGVNPDGGAILGDRPNQGGHVGPPLQKQTTLAQIIQWFKTMTTNEYIHGVDENNWSQFYKRLWQRNYYEHIIRDDAEQNRIHLYIESNVYNWGTDEENLSTSQS